jgi:hypothetical protein
MEKQTAFTQNKDDIWEIACELVICSRRVSGMSSEN